MPPRSLRRAALALAAAGLALSTAAPAHADPVSQLQSRGAGYVVYLVKDLGGGAYYNVTTGGLYAVQTAGDTAVTVATTGATELATLAANGRDLLLLVNGKVLVPVQQVLGG